MSTAEGSGNIITNGLITYYDAANPRSYPTTGPTWSDIVDSKHLTIFSGASYNSSNLGSISYSGDNLVSRASINTNVNVGDNFTVSVWMKAPVLDSTRRGMVGNSYNFAGRNGWFFSTAGFAATGTFFLSIGADIAYRVAGVNTLSANTWHYVSATVTNGGGNILLYRDGIVVTTYAASNLTSGVITYTNNQFHIGFRDLGGTPDPFTGNISLVQIYNRVLSESEITQNYNASKSRFGK